MRVVGIYGESGTGKSTSALSYAHEESIEAIIDDGILIKDGKKIAGISAKFEKNALKAVRRAIFQEEEHCTEVKHAIVSHQLESILIIGTSQKMIKKIANRLELPPIQKYVAIEEIRSHEEILLAKYIREMFGKHTMPIPKNEVEQNFFKRMIQKGWDIFSHKKEKIGETTIVSPDFHSQSIFINQRVYDEILHHIVEHFPLTRKIYRSHFQFTDYFPVIYVEIAIAAPVTYNLWSELTRLQKEIRDAFFTMVHIKLTKIHIHVKEIQSK